MANPFSLPYHHPSTVVFLDDNHQFLSDLELRLPDTMPYILHHSPAEALALVNRYARTTTLAARCFSWLQKDVSNWRDSVIEFDIRLIEEEVNSLDRFNRTSVVVVDFAMPAMNGLDFCGRITDPYVKKILLTGAADEKLAVRAFNDGLIDRFVLKNQPDSLDLMLEFTAELQTAHFVDQQAVLTAALSLDPPPFLTDPAVATDLERLARHRGYLEHYLVSDPPGFLCLDAGGRIERVVVLADSDVDNQTERLRACGAPANLVASMSNRRTLTYLYESLLGDDASSYPWAEFTFDTWRIEGTTDTWWLCLMPQPPVYIDFNRQSASLESYLDRLDAA